MPSIELTRVAPFYHSYIGRVQQDDLLTAFKNHLTVLVAFLNNIPENKWSHRYAEGKWSIREVVQHIIDAERIFCYRALRFARKDKTELPGFDENSFAAASKADRRSKESFLEELRAVQQSSALLFGSFDEEQLDASGKANGNPMYVRALGFIIIGHALHHKAIVEERYLEGKAASS